MHDFSDSTRVLSPGAFINKNVHVALSTKSHPIPRSLFTMRRVALSAVCALLASSVVYADDTSSAADAETTSAEPAPKLSHKFSVCLTSCAYCFYSFFEGHDAQGTFP